MDDDASEALRRLRMQVNTLATLTGQCLGVLAFKDTQLRRGLDEAVTHWEGFRSSVRSRSCTAGRITQSSTRPPSRRITVQPTRRPHEAR